MQAFSRLFENFYSLEIDRNSVYFLVVEGEGFEPSKHEAADLQSAGVDRSPTPPYRITKQRAILLLLAYYVNLIYIIC